jgi:probable phosphoglycerate mutase
MTTLYLVRHGQTKDNVAKIMQGQRHGELTFEGMMQIKVLAGTLAEIHFDALITSDLQRAYVSGAILSEELNIVPVTTTALLRERDWGDFTGRYIPELQGLPFPDNAETMDDLLNRAKRFLQWIKTNYPDQVVLAVGHGIINKAIQAVHYKKQTREIPRMQNAECRVLHL